MFPTDYVQLFLDASLRWTTLLKQHLSAIVTHWLHYCLERAWLFKCRHFTGHLKKKLGPSRTLLLRSYFFTLGFPVLRHIAVMASKTEMEKRNLTQTHCHCFGVFLYDTKFSTSAAVKSFWMRDSCLWLLCLDREDCTEGKESFAAGQVKSSLLGSARLSLSLSPPMAPFSSLFHLHSQLSPEGGTRVGVSLRVELQQNANKHKSQESSRHHIV